VHPKATIFAIAGPIVIGMGCIIEEGAIIVNRRVHLHLKVIDEGSCHIDEKKSCASGTTTFSKSIVVRKPHLPVDVDIQVFYRS